MSNESPSIFCPKCGSEAAGGTRFCRQCGINLQQIDQFLQGSVTHPQPRQPAERAEELIKQLQRDILWLAVRGIITLVIASPFFFILILSAAAGTGIVSLFLALILLVFIVLGLRDLSRAYNTFRDPSSALEALKAQKDEEREEAVRGSLVSSIEGGMDTTWTKNPVPSVTEHTTEDLDGGLKGSRSPTTKSMDQ